MKNNKKMIVKKKVFCPICGSATIRPVPVKIGPVKGRFICLNCKSIFTKPKKTKIELRKRPRYIG